MFLKSEGKLSAWLMYMTMQVALSAWQPKFFLECMQFRCNREIEEVLSTEIEWEVVQRQEAVR